MKNTRNIMGGPDCKECGDHFLSCHCESSEKAKEFFRSSCFLLREVEDVDTESLSKILCRIYEKIKRDSIEIAIRSRSRNIRGNPKASKDVIDEKA